MSLTITILLLAVMALPLLWLMKKVYNTGMAVAQRCYSVWGRPSGKKKWKVVLKAPSIVTERTHPQPSNEMNNDRHKQSLKSNSSNFGSNGSQFKISTEEHLGALTILARPKPNDEQTRQDHDPHAHQGEGDPLVETSGDANKIIIAR